jgi:hypothetical protein
MELVADREQVRQNLAYLDQVRLRGSGSDFDQYRDLVLKGTCFLPYDSGGTLAFAPSRFIGYRGNTFGIHAGNAQKDGRLTNPAITEVYGTSPKADAELDDQYRAFCASAGIDARESGSFGVTRKYWPVQERASPASASNHPQFVPQNRYTREEVAEIIDLPEDKRVGNWLTGYAKAGGEFFIFANVGVPGRTGHDYANRWDGDRLVWFGKTHTALNQREIQELISGDLRVNVFWRAGERAPFTFAGCGIALEVTDSTPVKIMWAFENEAIGAAAPKARLKWRPGPRPSVGQTVVTKQDGLTSVYLLVLDGPVASVFPDLSSGQSVVKVGMSNDPNRRVLDLSCGFPPGCALKWVIHGTREYPSGDDAYHAEYRVLEQLRTDGRGIGGEFAIVQTNDLRDMVASL